tara:strand:- start:118 stop:330 length:213 start_codon:yes stop_codon:yes gene_type:complete
MIEFKILALLTPNGFDDRFWKYAKETKTYVEAYEKTEIEYEKHFGKRKYSDYNSYTTSRNKRLKKHNRVG